MSDFTTETSGNSLAWNISTSAGSEDTTVTAANEGSPGPVQAPVSPPKHVVPGPNDTIFLDSGESGISGGQTATAGTWPNAGPAASGTPEAPKI